jgi:hypothetical protein
MLQLLSRTNLLAGGLAGVVLVVLVFGLNLPLWLGVLLALVAFAGLALLRPGERTTTAPNVPPATASLREGAAIVAATAKLGGEIPSPAIAGRVREITGAAERILAVLAEDRHDPQTVRTFVDRYLLPSQRLLTQHVRLSERGVASAAPALAKIEEADLPLLERKLGELYDALHRGYVIDPEVTSEMLEFDLAGVEPASPRRLEARAVGCSGSSVWGS